MQWSKSWSIFKMVDLNKVEEQVGLLVQGPSAQKPMFTSIRKRTFIFVEEL